MTDWTATAVASGLVTFDYSYFSLDIDPINPPSGNDFAGYILGNTFVQLADISGQSGQGSFAVTLGQTFGFRVGTIDNQGEPGILSISNFTAPGGGAAVPEPGTLSLAMISLGLIGVGVSKRKRAMNSRRNS